MKCPDCQTKMKVIKPVAFDSAVRRTLQCPQCRRRQMSLEQVVCDLPPVRRWGSGASGRRTKSTR